MRRLPDARHVASVVISRTMIQSAIPSVHTTVAYVDLHAPFAFVRVILAKNAHAGLARGMCVGKQNITVTRKYIAHSSRELTGQEVLKE